MGPGGGEEAWDPRGVAVENLGTDEGPFRETYRSIESRMRNLAEADGDVYVPNPEPSGPVNNVFICMEPSLGGGSPEKVRAEVEAGARNFVNSVEDFLLHWACLEPGSSHRGRWTVPAFSRLCRSLSTRLEPETWIDPRSAIRPT